MALQIVHRSRYFLVEMLELTIQLPHLSNYPVVILILGFIGNHLTTIKIISALNIKNSTLVLPVAP